MILECRARLTDAVKLLVYPHLIMLVDNVLVASERAFEHVSRGEDEVERREICASCAPETISDFG